MKILTEAGLRELVAKIKGWVRASYRTASAQDTIDSGKYSAQNPPPYPITTVNGQTGTVVLDAEDVGAATPEDVEAVADDLSAIEAVISSQATSTNKLMSASEVGDAIMAVEAKQLYATSSQGSFATKAALTAATTYYNADGSEATPTKNDVAYVLADESHEGKAAKYVIAAVDPLVWGFVIAFSAGTFTQAQMDAINSGITSTKRAGYDSHVSDSTIHVTSAEKSTWGSKQNVISDLAEIRAGASAGATAVQPESGKGLFSGNYNDLTNKPTIPSAVTESTVSGWGFTKNTGTYSKPSTGIPATDLASAVQTSLGKADSAYQKASSGIPATDLTPAAQELLGKADSAYQKPSGGIPDTDLAATQYTADEVDDLFNSIA